MGTKNTRFIPCAAVCEKPANAVRYTMRTIPPPSPIEAIIPVRNATRFIATADINFHPFRNILTPAIIISAPKMRFSRLFESFFIISAPIAAPTRPRGINFTACFISRLPPPKYIIPLIIDNGRVTAIEVAWAFFGSQPLASSIGTAIIPPPEPKSPLQSPTASPVNALKCFTANAFMLILLRIKNHPLLLSARGDDLFSENYQPT